MASAKDFCWTCRTHQDIVYTEQQTGRAFCKPCAGQLPLTSDELGVLFLLETFPYRVGDRVEARTAGTVFDGVGVVDDVSIELRNGGTPVFPSVHVKLETKEHDKAPDAAWYTEMCLTRVEAA